MAGSSDPSGSLKKDNGRLPVERSKDGILGAVDIHRISIYRMARVCCLNWTRGNFSKSNIWFISLFLYCCWPAGTTKKFSGGLFFSCRGRERTPQNNIEKSFFSFVFIIFWRVYPPPGDLYCALSAAYMADWLLLLLLMATCVYLC